MASNKNMDLDELEEMRRENERRLKELEEIYMRKRENTGVGRVIRERMGWKEEETEVEEVEKKGKKSVRIVESEKENIE